MKEFRSLTKSSERLQKGIELMTTESIKKTAELNELTDKVKDKRLELQKLEQELVDKLYQNKADIVNFNKNYTNRLDNKDKELKILEQNILDKIVELDILTVKRQKEELRIQQVKTEQSARERLLDTRDDELNKLQATLNTRENNIRGQECKWEDKLKLKESEYKRLVSAIEAIRKESDYKQQLNKTELDTIKQQKMVLEIRIKELNEKEERYQSDMRELLSAKQYKNV